MKYVLDASVAVRWVLRDLLQAKARQLRTAYQNRVHDLLAPTSSSPRSPGHSPRRNGKRSSESETPLYCMTT
jgi:hypothetical protein